MKQLLKLFSIVLAMISVVVLFSACDDLESDEASTQEPTSYTVVWKNFDGTVLETDADLSLGDAVSYDGQTPERATDYEYSYTFYGWDKEISAVTGDAEYTARFYPTSISYYGTITWKNYDGTVLMVETDKYYSAWTACYGFRTANDPYPFVPTREADAESDQYYFCGWEPTYQEGAVTYTAKFSNEPLKLLLPRVISKESFEKNILLVMREAVNKNIEITVSDGTIKNEDGKTILKNDDFWTLATVGEKYKHYDLVLMHFPEFDMSGPLDLKYDHFDVKKVGSYYTEKNLDKVDDEKAAEILAEYPIAAEMPVYVFDETADIYEQLQIEKYITLYAQGYTFEQLEKDHLLVKYEG